MAETAAIHPQNHSIQHSSCTKTINWLTSDVQSDKGFVWVISNKNKADVNSL